MKFDHLFFDSGGTLYGPGTGSDPSPGQVAAGRIKRVQALLTGMGIELDPETLENAITALADSCAKELGASYNFFRLMIALVNELDLPLGTEAAACLADAYAGPRYASWLFPGTREALGELHEHGYRMGIIANTAWPGFSMDRAFAGVGLLPFFDIRVYSGDIGLEKPDPKIFRLAERIGGLEGKNILYVGNDPEKDAAGPASIGWTTALRQSELITEPGTADLEFDHISELVHFCLDE